MDPVENMRKQLELARILADGDYSECPPSLTVDDYVYIISARLAELVLSLHDWRSSGGFDPYSNQTEF